MEFLNKPILLVLLCASCTTPHGKVDTDSLDFKQEAKLTGQKDKSVVPVKPQSVFHWQQFFKMPPDSNAREKLKASVDQLRVAKDPQDILKRARNELALGQFSAAEASYRQLLRLQKHDLDALIELAAIYHRTKKTESCLQVLAEIKEVLSAQEKPDELTVFRYRYILALAHIQLGDRERGHEILTDLIGQEKAFVPGYAALASSYFSVGKDSVAKFIVERGLDRGGDNPALLNLQGVINEFQGRPAIARENYNKAIQLSDGFAPALVNRANLYIKSRELTLAEGDLKKALKLDPLNVDAMLSLAVVLRQTGRIDIAKSTIRRVLDLEPQNPQARFNLALLMKDNFKNQTEALRLFSEVLQMEKASPELKNMARSAVEDMKNLY